MMGFLLLLGIAISAHSLFGGFDDAAPDADEQTQTGSDDDTVVDQSLRTNLEDLLGEDGVEEVTFLEGPLNVDSGAGDDIVAGGTGDDILVTSSGNDLVSGGAGDDTVDLGDGNDRYGSETSAQLGILFGNTDLGDDIIDGKDGDDQIADLFGSNRLTGGSGNDSLLAIDSSEEATPTPDQLDGGDGDDILVVDRGDTVQTGSGNDDVRVVLDENEIATDGSDTVVIEDFDPAQDVLRLAGVFEQDDLRLEPLDGGAGSVLFLNDIPVVRVIGGQDLTLADLIIAS